MRPGGGYLACPGATLVLLSSGGNLDIVPQSTESPASWKPI